jgi:hypothetical protein
MSYPITISDKKSLEVFKLLFDFGQENKFLINNQISQFWSEKINILLQAVQMLNIAYVSNFNSWPLATQGMYKKNIAPAFSIDVGTYIYDGLYNNSSYRLIYAFLWIIVSCLVFFVYVYVMFISRINVLGRVEFQRIYFKIMHSMYIPIALGILPTAICQYNNCSVSGPQVLISVISAFIFVAFLVAYPLYLIHHTYIHIISTDPEAYDEFIKLKEMEFLLGVSHSWLTEKLYLFSSYRSSYLRIYHRSVYYFFVLSLILIHGIFMGSNKYKLTFQTIICFIFALYITILPVYRCLSSSYLYSFTLWLVTANLFMGTLKDYGYQSQSMVDSNFNNLLIAINVTAVVLIVIIILLFLIFRLKWDIGVEDVQQLALGYRYLLADLRNAQKMILTLRTFNNFRFVKLEPIEKMEKILLDHYHLLSKENHPLQYTVVEQLDILTYMRTQAKPQTLLPCPKLERDYGLLVKVVNRRTREQILMSPVKRRLLLKLGVLKLLLGRRETQPFNSGENLDYIKNKTKDNENPDLNKFYQEFEDLESSREILSETKKDPIDEINELVDDIPGLLLVTQIHISNKNPDALNHLRKVWTNKGINQLPKRLRSKLFS